MPRGGRRSTTWASSWQSGKTKLVRVPVALAEEILSYALLLDRGEVPSVTDQKEILPVTDKNRETLKAAADKFLVTLPPKDRRAAKKLLYKFIESVE